MSYDNTNRMSIWGNTEKKDDRDADYTGSLNVGGVEYFVDLWKRKPDANPKAPALSGRVKVKNKQPGQQAPAPADNYPDDDIPF